MTTEKKPEKPREGSVHGHQEQTFRNADDKKSPLVTTTEKKKPEEPAKE